MSRRYEHVTLICQYAGCPRPGRTFQVARQQAKQKYCSLACSQAGIQAERIAQLRASPPMTSEQFGKCAQQFRRITPVLKAAARQVLVEGGTVSLVARTAGCSQQSLSRVVGKYRFAMKEAYGKSRSAGPEN